MSFFRKHPKIRQTLKGAALGIVPIWAANQTGLVSPDFLSPETGAVVGTVGGFLFGKAAQSNLQWGIVPEIYKDTYWTPLEQEAGHFLDQIPLMRHFPTQDIVRGLTCVSIGALIAAAGTQVYHGVILNQSLTPLMDAFNAAWMTGAAGFTAGILQVPQALKRESIEGKPFGHMLGDGIKLGYNFAAVATPITLAASAGMIAGFPHILESAALGGIVGAAAAPGILGMDI